MKNLRIPTLKKDMDDAMRRILKERDMSAIDALNLIIQAMNMLIVEYIPDYDKYHEILEKKIQGDDKFVALSFATLGYIQMRMEELMREKTNVEDLRSLYERNVD